MSIPAHSWANFAWTGESSPQDVADCFDEGKIAVMYRLDAETQVFERWIPGREEVSTMGDVAQFDALLALNASDQPATCGMLDPSAVPPRTLTIPASSWANFAWTGESSPQDVADCYDEGKIAVMYRLDAETQVFERWIPGREEVSTMGDVAQFDALLALNASDEPATCGMLDPSAVPARTLTIPAGSWANFAWTGESSPQDVADCYDEGKIAVMYRLDAETQVFERWIPGREEVSTMGDVAQFDALLVLNASDQPATCEMPGG